MTVPRRTELIEDFDLMFFAGARVSRTQQNQHFPFGGKAHKGCFLGNSHFESTYRSHSIPHLTVGNITFESMRNNTGARKKVSF
jgi:hypothetical protein